MKNASSQKSAQGSPPSPSILKAVQEALTIDHFTAKIESTETLGSRGPFFESLLKRHRKHRLESRKKWINHPEKIADKRKELHERLVYRPKPVPFRARLVRTEEEETFSRRYYELNISPDDRIEAVLCLPHKASSSHPVPGLIALHAGGGRYLIGKDRLHAGKNPAPIFRWLLDPDASRGTPDADYFAGQGFAVLAIDHLGYGDRAIWHEQIEKHRSLTKSATAKEVKKLILDMRYERERLQRALMTMGTCESEVSLHDHRRSIDFLETIPEVNSQAIGAFGMSVGSMFCHHLAAMDTRVKASARICWTADFGPMLLENGSRVLGASWLLPAFYRDCLIPELVALSYPNQVFILNGRKDNMYSFANQERTRKEILKLAKEQGDPGRVEWQYFDGPHTFRLAEKERVLQFFRKTLITRDPAVDG